jgi:hypothetical protein
VSPTPPWPPTALPWSPILDGVEREVAQDLLRDIAGLLRDPARYDDASLMHGSAGAALCLGYLGTAWKDAQLAADAVSLLTRATEEMAASPGLGLGLARGATGLGWAIEHVRREFLWTSEGDPNEALDEILAKHVDVNSQNHPLGLLDGMSGIGVYFIERLGTRPALPVLERILLCLVEAREGKMGFGRTWWTPPVFVHESLRASRRPFGHYDLGVAHGVPGIMGLLGQLARVGVGHSLVVGMLRRGIAWLLSKRLGNAMASLPRFHGTNVRAVVGPQTWEYGSISTAAVLHLATLAAGDSGRAAELLDWVRAATPRLAEEHPAAEAGLCRGAAGLGHVYNRLFHRTGDPWFAEQARRWLRQSLESLCAVRSSWREAAPGLDLMTGLAGSALVLLAATLDQEPAWDRCLLLSPPSCAGPPMAPRPS